jgi:hypothetical protein
MTTPTLSDRSLKQTELSLTTYLAPHFSDLVKHDTVASELGFNPSALGDILAAGLGPEPRPAFNAGCFWFAHWQVPLFWHWLTEQATIQDCSDIAAVMFRHYPALGEPDGEQVREHVLEALSEGRRHNDYSTRFRLFLGW